MDGSIDHSGSAPPLLNTPIDFSSLDQTKIQQKATQLAKNSPLAQDTIEKFLTHLVKNGGELGSSELDALEADNPILVFSDTSTSNAAKMQKVIDANPWFSPNPLVAFMINFMELLVEMMKIKLVEAIEVLAPAINMIMKMAKDIAHLIKDIAHKEMAMHIAAAVAAGVTATASVLSVAYSIGEISSAKTEVMGGPEGKTPTKELSVAEGMRIAGYTQAIQQMGSAVGKITEESTAAAMKMQKAPLEALKTIIEHALKIIGDRRMNSAIDAYKEADSIVSQLLQNLQKIIDENIRAHGFGHS